MYHANLLPHKWQPVRLSRIRQVIFLSVTTTTIAVISVLYKSVPFQIGFIIQTSTDATPLNIAVAQCDLKEFQIAPETIQ
jgi:hypothetical protein